MIIPVHNNPISERIKMSQSNNIEISRTRMGMRPFASGIFAGFRSPLQIFGRAGHAFWPVYQILVCLQLK